MQSKEDIEDLIRGLYAQLGRNPAEIQIKRQDGGWGTALTYKITRSNGEETYVLRQHIDDKRYDKIKAALRDLF